MGMSLAPVAMSPLLSDGAPPLGDSEFAAIARIMMTEARISLPSTKKVLVHSRLSRRLRQLLPGLLSCLLALQVIETT